MKRPLFSLVIAGFLLTASSVHADTTALSRNWAGYIASGSGYTSVGGTWSVSTVTDAFDPSADATWVGIGGVTQGDLIQSGTQAIVQDGQVTYQAWVETLPQELKAIPLAVSPGNSVTVRSPRRPRASGIFLLGITRQEGTTRMIYLMHLRILRLNGYKKSRALKAVDRYLSICSRRYNLPMHIL